jgi:hypothetical protein
MNEWSARFPRWRHKHDAKPDDDTPEGALTNHRLICQILELHIETVPLANDALRALPPLSGEEVLDVNVAFYRYEMFSKSPPATLAIDCTVEYRDRELRDAFDCDSAKVRCHRAAFSLDYHTDGVARMLNEYDSLVDSMRAYSSDALTIEPLPRDWCTDAKQLCGDRRKNVEKWRSPKKVFPYNDGAHARTGRRLGCFDLAPKSAITDAPMESMLEARHRLVATLCWFRRHQRGLLPGMIAAMRQRALRSAQLYQATERMIDAARIVCNERQRAPDVLTALVNGSAGDELGQALWPYLPPEMGCPVMASCQTLYQWGERFQRCLSLRIEEDAKKAVPHRVESDGSFTMLKNRRILLQPVLEHRFLMHQFFPPTHDPPFLLEQHTHSHPTHGSAIDVNRSTVRAFLVFDDAQRTEVPFCDQPPLRRLDGKGFQIGQNRDQTYAHFPKGKLPLIVVAVNCLSKDFGKQTDTRFRIVIEVSLVTKDAPTDLVSEVMHATETPPFRVVSRLESDKAAAASKARQANRRIADAYHLKLIRDHQPATSTDAAHPDDDNDAYDNFVGAGVLVDLLWDNDGVSDSDSDHE